MHGIYPFAESSTTVFTVKCSKLRVIDSDVIDGENGVTDFLGYD